MRANLRKIREYVLDLLLDVGPDNDPELYRLNQNVAEAYREYEQANTRFDRAIDDRAEYLNKRLGCDSTSDATLEQMVEYARSIGVLSERDVSRIFAVLRVSPVTGGEVA